MKKEKHIKNTQNGEATNAVPKDEFLGSISQRNEKHKRRTVMLVRKIMVIIMITLFTTTAMPAMADVTTPPSDADGFTPAAADDNSVITPSIANDAVTLSKLGNIDVAYGETAADGEVITWDAGNGRFEFQPVPGATIGTLALTQHRIVRGGAGGFGEESSTPTTGQVLTFNGTSTDFRLLDETNISTSANIPFSSLASLNRGHVLVGNASNEATPLDLSAAGSILKGDGTDAVELVRGSANQVLKVNAGGTDIEYGLIQSANIASNTITASNIANNTITANEIANNTITNAQIANNTITNTQLATNSVNSTNIVDNSVTSTDITDGTIVAGDINTTLLNQITLWEIGTNGTYEDDAAVIVGTDTAFTDSTGGVGDMRVGDELEVVNNVVVGANGSGVSGGLTTLGFVKNGEDLHVEDDVGIEGDLYVEGDIYLSNPIVSTATVTKNIFLELGAAVRNSATLGTISGGLTPAIKFNNSNSSTATWTFPVPDDWASGDINVKITWVTGGTDTGDRKSVV